MAVVALVGCKTDGERPTESRAAAARTTTATSVDSTPSAGKAPPAVPQGVKVVNGQLRVGGILQVDNTRAEFKRPVKPIGESVSCADGSCKYTCEPGKTCSATCVGGKCEHTCGAGAVCDFRCEGGDCKQICQAGSTCHLTCSGGGCARECGQAEKCNKACKGSGCTG